LTFIRVNLSCIIKSFTSVSALYYREGKGSKVHGESDGEIVYIGMWLWDQQ